MLSCHTLANRVGSDYIDGHLGWRKRLAVIFHLFLCVNCRRFIRQLKQLRGVLLRRSGTPLQEDAIPTSGHQTQADDYLHRLAQQLHSEYQRQNSGE